MNISFRQATAADLPALVQMLADDPLGQKRERYERRLPDSYQQAFAAIDADPNNELIIAHDEEQILGFFQLTFIPYLTYQGGWRALIEGVRVHKAVRSQGIGREMFVWAIERARQRGCHLIQLTTDKRRPEALEFYRALGFAASHEGMKLHFGA